MVVKIVPLLQKVTRGRCPFSQCLYVSVNMAFSIIHWNIWWNSLA